MSSVVLCRLVFGFDCLWLWLWISAVPVLHVFSSGLSIRQSNTLLTPPPPAPPPTAHKEPLKSPNSQRPTRVRLPSLPSLPLCLLPLPHIAAACRTNRFLKCSTFAKSAIKMQEPNGAWYTPSYAAKDVMPIIAIPVSPHTSQCECV